MAQYITPAEAAIRLGVGRPTIYAWLRSGDLQGEKLGPRLWRVLVTGPLVAPLPTPAARAIPRGKTVQKKAPPRKR